MTTLFLACAAVGSTILVVYFITGFFGHGDGVDGGGHDVHGGGYGADGGGIFFGVLSLRAIAGALAAFGLAGMAALSAGLSVTSAVGLGMLAGLLAMSLVVALLRTLRRMGASGTIDSAGAVDQIATVYVPIPGAYKGTGKISLDVQNRTLELAAVTHGADLATGVRVRVVQMVDAATAEVAAIGMG